MYCALPSARTRLSRSDRYFLFSASGSKSTSPTSSTISGRTFMASLYVIGLCDWALTDCTRPPRRHKHFSGPQRSCPKTARLVPIAPLLCRHATRSRPLLRSDQGARHAFRRRVLRGRFHDRHLLPARLHRAHAGSRPVHLLYARRQCRGRGISALPALPPRTRTGFGAHGLGAARLPACRRAHRRRIPVRRRHGRPGRRVFSELAPTAPRHRTRIRRYAGGTRADASVCCSPNICLPTRN